MEAERSADADTHIRDSTSFSRILMLLNPRRLDSCRGVARCTATENMRRENHCRSPRNALLTICLAVGVCGSLEARAEDPPPDWRVVVSESFLVRRDVAYNQGFALGS